MKTAFLNQNSPISNLLSVPLPVNTERDVQNSLITIPLELVQPDRVRSRKACGQHTSKEISAQLSALTNHQLKRKAR